MILIQAVKEQLKRFTRSKGWWKTRKAHLKVEPVCVICGRKKWLSVHHKKDFSTYPKLELVQDNLVTLCYKATNCHLLFGHLGWWKSINPDIEKDVEIWHKKFRERRAV